MNVERLLALSENLQLEFELEEGALLYRSVEDLELLEGGSGGLCGDLESALETRELFGAVGVPKRGLQEEYAVGQFVSANDLDDGVGLENALVDGFGGWRAGDAQFEANAVDESDVVLVLGGSRVGQGGGRSGRGWCLALHGRGRVAARDRVEAANDDGGHLVVGRGDCWRI